MARSSSPSQARLLSDLSRKLQYYIILEKVTFLFNVLEANVRHNSVERRIAMAIEGTPLCPRCGQLDAVRKVSSIVTEGVSVGQYQSVAPVQWQGKTYYLPAQRDVSFSTVLAQRLAPPRQPQKPKIRSSFVSSIIMMGLIVPSCFVMALVLGLIESALGIRDFASTGPGICLFLVGTVVVATLLVLAIPPTRSMLTRERQDNMQRLEKYNLRVRKWPQAVDRWQQLHYCGRCDGVFIPGQGRFVPIEQMESFLYE